MTILPLSLVMVGVLAAGEAMPLPSSAALPPPPPLLPSVATAGGQRRLLADVDCPLTWDAAGQRPVAGRAGWWVINAPFAAIRGCEGRSIDEVARAITGLPASQVRNWWLYTPGEPAAEPTPACGPAPVAPAVAERTLLVDQAHPDADDEGAGSATRPFRTLAAAMRRLAPGTRILVRPGLYRERVLVAQGGAATAPAVIEGVRDARGRLPVVSANDELPASAWSPEPGLPGVWRADNPLPAFGSVAVDGAVLEERDLLRDLAPGQAVVSRSSREFLLPRLDGTCDPVAGDVMGGRAWQRIVADATGGFRLPAGAAVYYLSTWVWVEPGSRAAGEVFDPTCPRPIGGSLTVGGFRAFRQAGSRPENQINQFRLWIDGAALPCVPRPGAPCPSPSWGDQGDVVRGVRLAEGWNHLLFQLDTSTRPQAPAFAAVMPPEVRAVRCSAGSPTDRRRGPVGAATAARLTEALLLGPFPAVREQAVYVRLSGDRDPRTASVDAAARDAALVVEAPFVEVRGLEFRHGAQFQQRALVNLTGTGDVLEGCVVREPEWNAVNVGLMGGRQSDPPTVVRGNWLLAPGGLGIGAGGEAASFPAAEVDRAPDRRRLVAEWNRITANNRMAHDRWWESGAMKLCRNVGAVVRYNEFLGGDGPGVWFDWENYGDRVEGNFSSGVTGCLVGVEASPGPLVIGANIAHDTRPGGAWFKYAFLAWSSAQVWTVNNTVDGAWNQQDAGWFGQRGADGIYLDEGGDDRSTLWGALPSRRQALLNNLIVGCPGPICNPRPGSLAAGNLGDVRPAAAALRFRAPGRRDYRLAAGEANADLPAGIVDAPEAGQVRYDFFGLPFANGVGRAVGACRVDPPVPAGAGAVIEVETVDGRFLRIIR